MRQKREAVFFVQKYCNLGVTLALEFVTLFNKVLSNGVITIKLAVDHGVDVAFRIVEWLLSFRIQVDNGQTIVAESYQTLNMLVTRSHEQSSES